MEKSIFMEIYSWKWISDNKLFQPDAWYSRCTRVDWWFLSSSLRLQLVILLLLYYPHWERSLGLHCTVINVMLPIGTSTGGALSEQHANFFNPQTLTSLWRFLWNLPRGCVQIALCPYPHDRSSELPEEELRSTTVCHLPTTDTYLIAVVALSLAWHSFLP